MHQMTPEWAAMNRRSDVLFHVLLVNRYIRLGYPMDLVDAKHIWMGIYTFETRKELDNA